MDLRHQLNEANMTKLQAVKEIETIKAKVKMLEREKTITLQELVLKQAGLNPSDSQLASLV